MSPIHQYRQFEQSMMRRPPSRRMDEIIIYFTENSENMRKAGEYHKTTYEEKAISEVLGIVVDSASPNYHDRLSYTSCVLYRSHNKPPLRSHRAKSQSHI